MVGCDSSLDRLRLSRLHFTISQKLSGALPNWSTGRETRARPFTPRARFTLDDGRDLSNTRS